MCVSLTHDGVGQHVAGGGSIGHAALLAAAATTLVLTYRRAVTILTLTPDSIVLAQLSSCALCSIIRKTTSLSLSRSLSLSIRPPFPLPGDVMPRKNQQSSMLSTSVVLTAAIFTAALHAPSEA